MKLTLVTGVIAAAMFTLLPVSSDAAQGKGGGGSAGQPPQTQGVPAGDQDQLHDRSRLDTRDKDRIRDQDRDRLQDPSKLSDDEIYGHELMSREELNRYRKQLASKATAEEQARYQYEHEERMRERAMQQGKDLVPPGQGPVYGGKLMSVEERNQYRETLRTMKSDEERQRFEMQHRAEIQERAKALQIEIEEAE